MKRRLFLAVLMACATTACPRSEAALFSSSDTRTRLQTGNLAVSTILYRPDNNNGVSSTFVESGDVASGVNRVAVTVDTAADTVRYDDIDFLPLTMPANSTMDSSSVNYSMIVTPANFPDPAVSKTVAGTYTSRILFDSLAIAAPTFVSSTTSPIRYTQNATSFRLTSNVTLSLPDIVATGTYEAIGATTTVSRPFSFALSPESMTTFAVSTTLGGPGFGNGFPFSPFSLMVDFRSTTSTPFFDHIVDDVRFAAKPEHFLVQFFYIPEPRTLALAIGLAAMGVMTRRRSGCC